MKKLLFALIIVLTLSACKDAKRAQFDALGKPHIITLLGCTGDTLRRVNERRIRLGLKPSEDLHITLLQLYVNMANPDSKIFYDLDFINAIKESFIKNIKTPQVELESIDPRTGRGKWDFYGRGSYDTKLWVRIYRVPDKFQQNITYFRRDIYTYINTRLLSITHKGIQMRGKVPDTDNFNIYESPKGDLYSVLSNQWFGINKWSPHISVLNLKELNTVNPILVQRLDSLNNVDKQTDELNKTISPNRQGIEPISSIKIYRDVTDLHISLNIGNVAQQLKLGITVNDFTVKV